MSQTVNEYREVIRTCKEIFAKKTRDYGTAWRILRLPSITDQIYIKAQRIRSIQEKGTQKVGDDVASEFVGIINYCIMALIQLDLKSDPRLEIPYEELEPRYDAQAEETLALLMNKKPRLRRGLARNAGVVNDRPILMKLLRVKQIEDNQGRTLISEGIDANYRDMINYSVFCLIKMKWAKAA
jgi:hypothetical protein